jgi:hypothetical protein
MYWPELARYLASGHNQWITSYNSIDEEEHINYVAWSGSCWSAAAVGGVHYFTRSFYVTI